jgi:hypothetical protein
MEYFDPCVFVLYFSLVTITMLLRGKNLVLIESSEVLGIRYFLYEMEQEYQDTWPSCNVVVVVAIH